MRFWFLPVISMLLGGCAGGVPGPRTFDLGVQSPNPGIPAVRVAAVRASPPFDGAEMHYRLAWRDPAEIASYSQSRWSAPPADLLRRQLLRATREGAGRCALRVELHDFSQVFSRKDASDARIELQASLFVGTESLGHRRFVALQPDAGPDAGSGARALSRAAGEAIHQIGDWLSKEPRCR